MRFLVAFRYLALAVLFQASMSAHATCSVIEKVGSGPYAYYKTELYQGVSSIDTTFTVRTDSDDADDLEILHGMESPTYFCYHASVEGQSVVVHQLTHADEWDGN